MPQSQNEKPFRSLLEDTKIVARGKEEAELSTALEVKHDTCVRKLRAAQAEIRKLKREAQEKEQDQKE